MTRTAGGKIIVDRFGPDYESHPGQTQPSQVHTSSSQQSQPSSQTPHGQPASAASVVTDANSVADDAADTGHVPPLAQQLGKASVVITKRVAASQPQASHAQESHVQSASRQQPQPASHCPQGHDAVVDANVLAALPLERAEEAEAITASAT
ncbi:hypothetical protein [Rubripirellula tenax]|uniref:hypothetical protein n=1 Tax=Rubripirellula tenax TaxID=2528015 RepID=UPI0011B6E7D2|nr:hypothetical protein [Rubripirellula tenax]